MRRATQVEAKTGTFIDSYEKKEDFELAVKRLERAVRLQHVTRELVYVVLPVGGVVQWQIFLLP